MLIDRLWLAMLTRELVDAETDSSIRISVNTNGFERLNHTFADSEQSDQERGIANLYDLDVTGKRIQTEQLTDSSIRLGINGDDAWLPQHAFVFAEGVNVAGAGETQAVAIETDIATELSTDPGEGQSDMPIRLVGHGSAAQAIRRLFIFIRSIGSDRPADDDGATAVPHRTLTDAPLEIQIVSQGRVVVLFQIRDTPQEDLEFGEANFYTMPVMVPFTRAQLDGESITLRIMGMDDYEPLSLFIFGADVAAGRPTSMVPLVSIPDWSDAGLGVIDYDPTNGTGSVTLPLAPLPSEVPAPVGLQSPATTT
ncbi:MAG TPA: hypothetical protein VH417_06010 [Vicinamibacterales bacterium]|jgi:hypothetical protein